MQQGILDTFKQEVDGIKQSHEQHVDQAQINSQIDKAKESFSSLESEEVKNEAKQYMENELALLDLEKKTDIINQISETKGELEDFAKKIGEKIGELREKYNVTEEEVGKEAKRYAGLTKLPVIGTLVAPGIVAAKKFIEHSEMGKKISSALGFLGFDNADNSLPNMIADYAEKQRKKVVNRVFRKMGKPAPYALVDKNAAASAVTLSTDKLSGEQKQSVIEGREAGKAAVGRDGIHHNEKKPDASKRVYSPFKGKIVGFKNDVPENTAEGSWKSDTLNYGNYLVMEITEGPLTGKTYHVGHLDTQMITEIGKEIEVGDQLATIGNGSGSGTEPHFSDAIGNEDAKEMTEDALKNHHKDSQKLAGITINGDTKKVEGNKWKFDEEKTTEDGANEENDDADATGGEAADGNTAA